MTIDRRIYMEFTGSLTEAVKAQGCGYTQKYGHYGSRSIRVKLYKLKGRLDVKKLLRFTDHGDLVIGLSLHYHIRRVDPDVLTSITFHLRVPFIAGRYLSGPANPPAHKPKKTRWIYVTRSQFHCFQGSIINF